MARKSVYQTGQFFGQLEVLEILSSTSSAHVDLKLMCHFCKSETIKNSKNIKKRNSCGCMQHNSASWKNKGPKNKSWQLESGVAAKNSLVYQYKRSAKKRNLEYSLTADQFDSIISANCAYCGAITPALAKGQGITSGDFKYTGIDRIDSNAGYTISNCVPCCWLCNDMKGKMNKEQFMQQIKRIYMNQHQEREIL